MIIDESYVFVVQITQEGVRCRQIIIVVLRMNFKQ
jgi:hypothetical protein